MLNVVPRLTAVLSVLVAISAITPVAAEDLYDAYGRRIPDSRIYQQPQQYYPAPPQQYYPPEPYFHGPNYDGYPPRRQSRYQQGNVCATPYGTCELVGPTFVGKGCRCAIPGVGRVGGSAQIQ